MKPALFLLRRHARFPSLSARLSGGTFKSLLKILHPSVYARGQLIPSVTISVASAAGVPLCTRLRKSYPLNLDTKPYCKSCRCCFARRKRFARLAPRLKVQRGATRGGTEPAGLNGVDWTTCRWAGEGVCGSGWWGQRGHFH